MSLRVVHKGMFAGVIGSNIVSGFIPPQDGIIHLKNLSWFADAVGTFKIYPAKYKTVSTDADSADTTTPVSTDASGFIGGGLITTSDYLLIGDTTGTGWQLRAISNVGTVSSSVVILTVAAATWGLNDPVYLIRAADITSRATTADENVIDSKDQGVSYDRMPICAVVAAAGNNTMTGSFDVLQ